MEQIKHEIQGDASVRQHNNLDNQNHVQDREENKFRCVFQRLQNCPYYYIYTSIMLDNISSIENPGRQLRTPYTYLTRTVYERISP
jgi:hypothetical protein